MEYLDSSYDFYTHVTLGDMKGKWNLQRHNIEKFWDTYCNTHDNEIYSIAERPFNYSMLVFDIDFKAPYISKLFHLYGEDDINIVVEACIESIERNLVNIDIKKTECVVLVKDPYIKTTTRTELKSVVTKTVSKREISHGFHLQFPNVFVDKHTRKVIRESTQEELLSRGVSIILDNMDNKPWMLYGSCKNKVSGKYVAAYILDKNMEKRYIEDWLETYELYDTNEDLIVPSLDDLPRVLSIFPYGRSVTERKEVSTDIGLWAKTERREIEDEDEYDDVEEEKKYNICKTIISNISPIYADDRDSWRSIGSALHNVLRGSDEGLDLFIEFSESSYKFNIEVCKYEWRNFKKYHTIRTLRYYFNLSKKSKV